MKESYEREEYDKKSCKLGVIWSVAPLSMIHLEQGFEDEKQKNLTCQHGYNSGLSRSMR